ncbi:MAG: GTPase ObgE [Clostridiales bacterium]|jgi:GTP-binding protein|nr:GTPase ObgE [Clostridiales bacterium]HOK81320.1 GTPase ObgE [Clostridia bacterium]HOL60439.1 GTPase ObgE [Clostridia bacterium]HPO53196.1 GTPase ObgE [Clostridia bacterium]
MFLDKAVIICKAGNGGDGAVSFHRQKYVPKGGPDGGDGGNGGNVYIEADASMNTLINFSYTKRFIAGDGENGDKNNKYGKSGKDIILKVPRGTIVRDYESGAIVADVYNEGERILLLKGGKGGRGNAKFATPTRRSPGFSELGEKTKERKLVLELKTIADVGLVGYPNVGKSTLLSVISAARPKIDNYPFTTLTPNLGVVRYHDDSFVVADIPGLIDGAAEGVGLGHEFLRHIERVRLIVHVVDVSGSEGRSPAEDYTAIRKELKKYSEKLAGLPEIVVANKCDLLADNENLKSLRNKCRKKVVEISAATTQGIDALIALMAEKLRELPPPGPIEFEPFSLEEKVAEEFIITEEGEGVFRVSGSMIENLARKVVLSDPESFRWFQKVLRDKGVIAALKEKGIKDGDTVRIQDIEFEYTA